MPVCLMMKKVHSDKSSWNFKIGGIKILLKGSFSVHSVAYYILLTDQIEMLHICSVKHKWLYCFVLYK